MPVVRPAKPIDAEALVDLLDQLDRFYGDQPQGTADDRMTEVMEVLFSPRRSAHALVACGEDDDEQLLGLATYTYLWPAAGVTRSLYLKELYVTQEHRRTSVGRLLMDAVVETARESGCTRVEFTTDTGNRDAQAFYTSLGYSLLESKLFYRLGLDA